MKHTTAAILSVITGNALASVQEIQRLLSEMTGDRIYTHQIPRALDACAPALREQFPQYAGVEVPEGMRGWEAVHAWLAQFPKERYSVLPLSLWQHRDPAAELAEMRGGVEDIIVVGDKGLN